MSENVELNTLNTQNNSQSSTEDEGEDSVLSTKKNQQQQKAGARPGGMSKIGTYPTRLQYVGNMLCLFCSCYRQGRFPFCSIGPSWPFTIGLLVFAVICLGYLCFMLAMIQDSGKLFIVAGASICCNLLLLFGGICGDPGVKPKTYLHYSKMKYQNDGEATSSDEDASMDQANNDEENTEGNSTAKLRNQKQQKLKQAQEQNEHYRPERYMRYDEASGKSIRSYYCYKCNCEMTSDMDHCDDCDLCIYDYDHHCVFFSKCIGGGNIKCFYGAIGGLIFNFVLVGIFVCVDASQRVSVGRQRVNNQMRDHLKQTNERKRDHKQHNVQENSLEDHHNDAANEASGSDFPSLNLSALDPTEQIDDQDAQKHQDMREKEDQLNNIENTAQEANSVSGKLMQAIEKIAENDETLERISNENKHVSKGDEGDPGRI